MCTCVHNCYHSLIVISESASVCLGSGLCACVYVRACKRLCGVCVENKALADNVSIVAGALRPSLSQGPQG